MLVRSQSSSLSSPYHLANVLSITTIFIVTALTLTTTAVSPVSAQPQQQMVNGTIRIGTFNIQIFGVSKFADRQAIDHIVRILQRFDLVAIQEIRDATLTAFPKLVQQLNLNSTSGVSGAPRNYTFVIGSRQGRTSSKEQYAFIYNTAKIRTVGPLYEYPVAPDQFERPPFAAQFEVIAFGPDNISRFPRFVLVNIHTKPEAAVAEIDALVYVYDAVNRSYTNPNILTLGDYNAGCGYVSNTDFASIRFYTQSRFKWLIPNTADTTVSTDCAYDRLVVGGDKLQASLDGGSAKAFNFEAAYNLNRDQAKDVSDHYPVGVEMTVLIPGGSTGTGSAGDSSTGVPDLSPAARHTAPSLVAVSIVGLMVAAATAAASAIRPH